MISFFGNSVKGDYDKLAYDFTFNDINGKKIKLDNFKNKVILIVNVASKCGFTKQYEDLQTMWEKYQKKDLILIGVPSNDFGNQEPGTNSEIKNFCESKFGITFLLTEKVEIKGKHSHPFYIWAKENYGKSAIPKWNFHKIIIDKSGRIFETFSSITNPSSKKFGKVIENLLQI